MGTHQIAHFAPAVYKAVMTRSISFTHRLTSRPTAHYTLYVRCEVQIIPGFKTEEASGFSGGVHAAISA